MVERSGMNKHRILFLLLGCSLILVTTAVLGSGDQPIQFSHKVHISDLGMDCPECHVSVLKSRKATLPGRQVCIECHEEALGESSEEQKLVALLQSGRKLNWKRIYVLPKHVYFSHFRHVTLGQIACSDCHGDMKALERPPERPAIDILNMDHCLECHKGRSISNDCLTCHD